MKRKKVCPHCGRNLWLSSFYRVKSGGLYSWCKECTKQNKREWYAANRKKPDGTYYDSETGRCYIHKGLSKRIMWSRQMLDDLRTMFPTTINKELAEFFGVGERTVIRKARELGLEKDKEWLSKVWGDNRLLAYYAPRNKDNPGCIKKGEHRGLAHEFKKGHQLSEESRRKRSHSMKVAWIKRRCMNHKKVISDGSTKNKYRL